MNTTYIFNPSYQLFNDVKRVIISESLRREDVDPLSKDAFTAYIHPIYALSLLHFTGKLSFEDTIREISSNLALSYDELLSLFKNLIENNDSYLFEYNGITSGFPPRTLIKYEKRFEEYVLSYNLQDFIIPHSELDFESNRFYKPISILHVLNLECATRCIYCYADKGNKEKYNQLNHQRILELIDEAYALGMRNYDLNGGEILLQPHWEEILERLSAYGFIPYVSTKLPLDEATVVKYKNTGMKSIQISLDSLNESCLSKMLGVKNGYKEKMLRTFELLEKYEIVVNTNSILTSYNTSSTDISELFQFFLSFGNIDNVRFSYAGYSLHLSPEENAKTMVNLTTVKRVNKFMEELRSKSNTMKKVRLANANTVDLNFRLPMQQFCQRAKCSGNMYKFTILPDGKVTYCEELYWHPAFIMGDLSTQSIEEMWNSEKAIQIYNMTHKSQSKKTKCHQCVHVQECYPNPGLCFKDIIGSYGKENWDYPDPRCPDAPELLQPYFHKE